jgi:hypothetical protein
VAGALIASTGLALSFTARGDYRRFAFIHPLAAAMLIGICIRARGNYRVANRSSGHVVLNNAPGTVPAAAFRDPALSAADRSTRKHASVSSFAATSEVCRGALSPVVRWVPLFAPLGVVELGPYYGYGTRTSCGFLFPDGVRASLLACRRAPTRRSGAGFRCVPGTW